MTGSIFIGGGGPDQTTAQELHLKYANRHGLITGATGTGKTVTLQILIEGFAAAGVPVFAADIKGDLSGLAMAGDPAGKAHAPLTARAAKIGMLDFAYRAFPAVFWDLFGQAGHPVRTTVTDMGPLLLAQLLELTDVQEGVLNIAFRVADDEGLALLDLADLRSMLVWLADNSDTVARQYGNVATSSVGAIQRALLVLENQGAAAFFGEPALDLADLMAAGPDGEGRVNILMADKLMGAPRVYAMFLLWLLSELFETLPEVGNPDKPVLVFFFDEAHLLFDSAPRALIDRIEQMVRLIRSKGVGVYFVTQNPDDVPPDVLGQLGNRIQHALRAYTPREAKALRAAAQTFRPNPAFDTETAIREVGTGEAVVSLLQDKAVPGMVERTLIRPPTSRMGPLTGAERQALMAASPVAGRYDTAQDPVSAHEILAQRANAAAQAAASLDSAFDAVSAGSARRYGGPNSPEPARAAPSRAKSDPTLGQALAKTFAKQLSSRQGQAMVRGILGSLFKGR